MGRGPHVGDGKDGVVVCMLELVVRVRLLWVEYLGYLGVLYIESY